VIWILGRGGDEVKGKKSARKSTPKILNQNDLLHNPEVGRLWKSCWYSDPSALRFPSKGAEHQGLLIPDPQQQEGSLIRAVPELSTQDSEASKPYSYDYAQGYQDA